MLKNKIIKNTTDNKQQFVKINTFKTNNNKINILKIKLNKIDLILN